jgi:hypothetical protein
MATTTPLSAAETTLSLEDYDALVSYVGSLKGEARTGISWAAFSAFLASNRGQMQTLYKELIDTPWTTGCPVLAPTGDMNYEEWPEKRRRESNLDALCVLGQMKLSARTAPTSVDLAHLQGYTGWADIDVWKLPVDPNLLPPEYLAGVTKARQHKPIIDTPFGRARLFPSPILSEAMWGLGQRLVPSGMQASDILILGQGAGRFVQSAPPASLRMTIVEPNVLDAEILSATYPEVEVESRPFVKFAVESEKASRAFDVILLDSDPYGYGRTERERKLDAPLTFAEDPDNQSSVYEVYRALTLLRPGGVLVATVPTELVFDPTGAQRYSQLRQRFVQAAHLSTVIFLPYADLYAGTKYAPRAVVAFVKRAPATVPMPSETSEAFVHGDVQSTSLGQNNTMGRWVGLADGRQVVRGDTTGGIDPYAIVDAQIEPLPYAAVAQITQARRAERTVQTHPRSPIVRTPPPTPVAATNALSSDAARDVALDEITGPKPSALAFAIVLSSRVETYMGLLTRSAPDDRARAEGGRTELRQDIEHFVDRYGNPHALAEVARNPHCAALVQAIRQDGSLIPALTSPQSDREFGAPLQGAGVLDIVDFYSKRNGVCTETDLLKYFGDVESIVESVLAQPEYALEFNCFDANHVPSAYCLYRYEDYLTGDLWARLAQVNTTIEGLPADDTSPRREKLKEQRGRLDAVIDALKLSEIHPTPRSGFIPLPCLQEFVNARLKAPPSSGRAEEDTLAYDNEPNITLSIEDGRLKGRTNGSLMLKELGVESTLQMAELTWILAYWNRETQIVDPDEKLATKSRVFTDGMSLLDKLTKEELLERDFETWLLASDVWRPQIEQRYNLAYRGLVPRKPDESKLGLLRQSARSPHPHQNAATRRFTETRGGLAAHSVGVGKTFAASLTLANWRQRGLCRKPVVVAPNNVMVNWLREIRAALPDYRVGVIGWTMQKGVAVQDSRESRREKWERYRAGDYDVLLCPYSNWLNDLDVSDELIYSYAKNEFAFQRFSGSEKEDHAYYERRLDELEDQISKKKASGASSKVIDELQEKIEKVEAYLATPPRSLLPTLERALAGAPLPTDTLRPYRPRTGEAVGEDEEDADDWVVGNSPHELAAYAQRRGIFFSKTVPGTVEITPQYAPDDETVAVLVLDLARDIQASGQSREVSLVDFLPEGPEGQGLFERRESKRKKKGKGRPAAPSPKAPSKKQLVALMDILFPRPPAQPDNVPVEPRPALIDYASLGVDALIVDEAHNFKNTWFPNPRLGAAEMEYCGAIKSIGERPTSKGFGGVQAWDMWYKCRDIQTRRGGNILLLTATPVKNSPLEAFNLAQLISYGTWERRYLRSSEEFIDRFIVLAAEEGTKITFEVVEKLTVKAFSNDGQELRAALLYLTDRITTDDLLAYWARIGYTKGKIPLQVPSQLFVDMDPIQNFIYDKLGVLVEQQEDKDDDDEEAERKKRFVILEIDGEKVKIPKSMVNALMLDIGTKAAIDPRLLTLNIADCEVAIQADDVRVEAWDRWEEGKRQGRGGSAPKKRPLSAKARDFLEKKYLLLVHWLGAGEYPSPKHYGDSVLPKYAKVAEYIRGRGDCGHVIFSDFNETHDAIKDAIVRIAGVPAERIGIIVAQTPARTVLRMVSQPVHVVKPSVRQLVADGFNGTWDETLEKPTLLVEPIYDVVIGNSQAMAEGLNLQKRTCAIHHLTFTWEPATITQRNGRGVRQGNKFDRVDVRYYIAGNDPREFPLPDVSEPCVAPEEGSETPNPSYDFYRFDKTVGKSGWQETLFSSDTRSSGNPFAEAKGISKEDLQYMMLARKDPMKACEIRRIHKIRAKSRARTELINKISGKVGDLVRDWRMIRKTDPGAQQDVQLARAYRDEAGLREILESHPDLPSASGIWAAVEAARKHSVYVDAHTGFYVIEGERVCLRALNPSYGDLFYTPRKIEIEELIPAGNAFHVRDFGSPFRRNVLMQNLLDQTAQAKEMVRLDMESCGGWDEEEDKRQILARSLLTGSSITEMVPSVLLALLPVIWKRIVNLAYAVGQTPPRKDAEERAAAVLVDHRGMGLLPLVNVNDKNEIVLLSASAATAIASLTAGVGKEFADLLTHKYVPLLPANADPASRARVMQAIITDTIRVVERAPGQTAGVRLSHLDPNPTVHGDLLKALDKKWLFNPRFARSGIAKSVFERMERSRRARARGEQIELAEETESLPLVAGRGGRSWGLSKGPVIPPEDADRDDPKWSGVGGIPDLTRSF